MRMLNKQAQQQSDVKQLPAVYLHYIFYSLLAAPAAT